MKPAAVMAAKGFGLGVLVCIGCFNIPSMFGLFALPAYKAAHWWTYELDMPPRSEAAWVVVPVVAILAQWTLIGFLYGCVRRILSLSKRSSELPPADAAGSRSP